MIRINLLPFRAARKKENIRQQVSVFILVFIFLSSLLIWYSISLGKKTERLKSLISTTEKELKNYNEINKEIAEIKKKLQVLKTKTEVIDQLQIKRKESVQMLDAMTELIVADRMWFTSFRAVEKVRTEPAPQKGKQPKKGKSVSAAQTRPNPPSNIDIAVRGIALDNKTVADFMTQLEMSPLFENVNLKTIKQIAIKGLSLMEFEVSFSKVQQKKVDDQAA